MKKDLKLDWIDENGILPAVIDAIENAENVAFIGATGTGKTFLIRELAKALEVKLYTLNMTTGITTKRLVGKHMLRPSPKADGTMEVYWVDGLLTKAMKEGAWLVIEEANFMPEDMSSNFYSVMDDRRELVLDERESEVIKAHPNFRLFLTGNWDYRGTTRFNDAIANRIQSYFDVGYLSVGLESRLISDRSGLSLSVCNKMATFAASIRANASKSGYPDLSTRTLINWANKTKRMECNPCDSAEYTVIPTLTHTPKEKEILRQFLAGQFKARKRDEDD